MSESPDSATPEGQEPEVAITDEELPEDLRPSDENPLAEGLPDQETVDDLLTGGKHAEQDDGQDDRQHDGQDEPDIEQVSKRSQDS